MRLILKSDADAYQWLLDNVYPFGEFRIHTNKTGIRLYICFHNPNLLGRYCSWTSFEKDNKDYFHPDAYLIGPNGYTGTQSKATLKECLEEHAQAFRGNSDLTNKWVQMITQVPLYGYGRAEFKGTLEDFVDAHNKYQEERRRNDYFNIEVSKFDK